MDVFITKVDSFCVSWGKTGVLSQLELQQQIMIIGCLLLYSVYKWILEFSLWFKKKKGHIHGKIEYIACDRIEQQLTKNLRSAFHILQSNEERIKMFLLLTEGAMLHPFPLTELSVGFSAEWTCNAFVSLLITAVTHRIVHVPP